MPLLLSGGMRGLLTFGRRLMPHLLPSAGAKCQIFRATILSSGLRQRAFLTPTYSHPAALFECCWPDAGCEETAMMLLDGHGPAPNLHIPSSPPQDSAAGAYRWFCIVSARSGWQCECRNVKRENGNLAKAIELTYFQNNERCSHHCFPSPAG